MDILNSADIQIFKHHIYEYHKGIRNMVLHTMHSCYREEAEDILTRKGIAFHTSPVSDIKINIFFGSTSCVDIIKSFGHKTLNDYTDEQDFILGIMLGYDRKDQCKRYNKRKDERLKKHCAA